MKEGADGGELVTIRKLMILALLRSGMTQAEIGAALGVHRTQIGRMFPNGGLADTGRKSTKQPKSKKSCTIRMDP